VDSFIDHFWLNVLATNLDWGVLSAWLYKDRGGKINGGPIWDFDRTMGCDNDGRSSDPRVWDPYGSRHTWFSTNYPWYGRVLGYSVEGEIPPAVQSTRPAEYQRAVDRWFQLRRGPFSVANMNAVIEGMAAQLSESQVRNFVRWTNTSPPNNPSFADGLTGWHGEVAHLKGWLAARVAWIDSQFPAMPAFNVDGGVVPAGFQVTLTAPAGTIYYTLNGSDPRLPNGKVAPGALVFSGDLPAPGNPIALKATTLITARSKTGNHWSAPKAANFVIGSILSSAANLVVSEVMYHPADTTVEEAAFGFLDSDEFEWIELMNIGAQSVNIEGVHFAAGLAFDFSDSAITTLAPGARVLAVRNRKAFQVRYGHELDGAIAGGFANATALNNGGERLAIVDSALNTIKDFIYDDRAPWPLAADGAGYSLVLINPVSNPDHSVAANWRLSARPGGTPGAGDSVTFTGNPTADNDFDGLGAFAEHALSTNPLSPASGPGVAEPETGANGTLFVSFPRNLAADDVVITLQVSFDLVTWSTDPKDITFVSETPAGDGAAEVVYRITASPGTDQAFVRLRITSR